MVRSTGAGGGFELAGTLLVLSVLSAGAQEVRLRTLDESVRARLVGIDGKGILTLDQGGKERRFDLREAVSLSLAGARQLPAAPRLARFELRNGDVVFGKLVEAREESFVVEATSIGRMEIPLLMVRVVRFPDSAQIQVDRGAKTDVLYVRGGDRLAGRIQGIGPRGIKFLWMGTEKVIPFSRIGALWVGLEMAAPNPDYFLAIVQCSDWTRLQGQVVGLAAGVLVVRSVFRDPTFFPTPPEFRIPLSSVVKLTFKNGRFVYLSDRTPIRTKRIPFLSRYYVDYVPIRFDRNREGGPLRLGGRTYQKGICSPAGTWITYRIGGEFRRFQADVGVDDFTARRGNKKGTAIFRVLVDGKKVFDSGVMETGMTPRSIDLPLDKAGELTLWVEFGPLGITNSWANWAGARLVR